MTHFKNLRPLTILAAILIGLMNGCFSENSKIENLAENGLKERFFASGTKIKSVTAIRDVRLNAPGIADTTMQRTLFIKIAANEPNVFVGGRYDIERCFGILSDIELEHYRVLSVGKCDISKDTLKEIDDAITKLQESK